MRFRINKKVKIPVSRAKSFKLIFLKKVIEAFDIEIINFTFDFNCYSN